MADNLAKLADDAGVVIVSREQSFGGTHGYRVDHEPLAPTWWGFRSATEARKGWLVDALGKRGAEAVLKLLKNQE